VFAYAKAYRHNYAHPSRLQGFRCRWTRAGSDIGSAVCTKDKTTVSFGVYDSSPFH
jgi:hypothetical protein